MVLYGGESMSREILKLVQKIDSQYSGFADGSAMRTGACRIKGFQYVKCKPGVLSAYT